MQRSRFVTRLEGRYITRDITNQARVNPWELGRPRPRFDVRACTRRILGPARGDNAASGDG